MRISTCSVEKKLNYFLIVKGTFFFPPVRVTVDDPWIWSEVKEYYRLKLAFREHQYCCKIWSNFKEQEQTQAICSQNGGCAGVALLVHLAGAMLCWTAFYICQSFALFYCEVYLNRFWYLFSEFLHICQYGWPQYRPGAQWVCHRNGTCWWFGLFVACMNVIA